jgi:hypothetical protein
VYSFSVVAVKNHCHNFMAKNHDLYGFFFYDSRGQKSKIQISTWPCSFWRLQDRISFLAFSF